MEEGGVVMNEYRELTLLLEKTGSREVSQRRKCFGSPRRGLRDRQAYGKKAKRMVACVRP